MIYTKYKKAIIDSFESRFLFYMIQTLKNWDPQLDKKFTGPNRKTQQLKIGDYLPIDNVIRRAMFYSSIDQAYIKSVEIILFEHEMNYLPTRAYKDTRQLVIHFGAPRVYKINSNEYKMKSGDVLFFGASNFTIFRTEKNPPDPEEFDQFERNDDYSKKSIILIAFLTK